MEFSFLLLERRSAETYTNLLHPILGTGWNADALLDTKKKPADEGFTWQLRKPEPLVTTPLTLALTQNSKFSEQIKLMARDLRTKSRKDSSILNLPKSSMLHNTEVVDLSYAPKEQFLKFAGRL